MNVYVCFTHAELRPSAMVIRSREFKEQNEDQCRTLCALISEIRAQIRSVTLRRYVHS
jgi:predicted RNA-binding protein